MKLQRTIRILTLIAIVILLAWGYDIYYQRTQSTITSSIATAPVVNEVIAIGINVPPDTTITSTDVMAGTYPILAVRVRDNAYAIDIINRIGSLSQYDSSGDGTLNNADFMFKNLALGYINPDDNTIRFVPLAQVGISSIVIAPEYYLQRTMATGLPPGYWQAHSKLVIANGSHWLTYHVPISSGFIAQLKTPAESSQRLLLPIGTAP